MTNVKYGISREKLDRARGELIMTLSQNITWLEFAKMSGLSQHTISGIRTGRTGGRQGTIEKIVSMLRRNGIVITEEDLLTPRE